MNRSLHFKTENEELLMKTFDDRGTRKFSYAKKTADGKMKGFIIPVLPKSGRKYEADDESQM